MVSAEGAWLPGSPLGVHPLRVDGVLQWRNWGGPKGEASSPGEAVQISGDSLPGQNEGDSVTPLSLGFGGAWGQGSFLHLSLCCLRYIRPRLEPI